MTTEREPERLVGRAVEAAARDAYERWVDRNNPEGSWDDEPESLKRVYRRAVRFAVETALGVVADHCTTEAIRESEASFRLPAVDQQALGAIVAYRAVAAECRGDASDG